MATHGLPAWPWTDAPCAELPLAEGLVLEGLRLWGGAVAAGRPPLPTLRLPFIAEGVGEAAEALEAVLRAAGRDFRLGEVPDPQMLGDEPALMLALALAQRGPRREALAAFLRLMRPGPAYAAMGAAIGLGISLRRGGVLLRHPLRA